MDGYMSQSLEQEMGFDASPLTNHIFSFGHCSSEKGLDLRMRWNRSESIRLTQQDTSRRLVCSSASGAATTLLQMAPLSVQVESIHRLPFFAAEVERMEVPLGSDGFLSRRGLLDYAFEFVLYCQWQVRDQQDNHMDRR